MALEHSEQKVDRPPLDPGGQSLGQGASARDNRRDGQLPEREFGLQAESRHDVDPDARAADRRPAGKWVDFQEEFIMFTV